MKLLFCSVGRRGELIKDFKDSMKEDVTIVATDNSQYAPALYIADKQYLVPLVTDPTYVETILNICKQERIDAVATFIDPEIEILSKNRSRFKELGVQVLVPYEETARYCFDKYKMFKYLKEQGIPTVNTYGTLEDFIKANEQGEIGFPVFVKPRTGSGSIGARRVEEMATLNNLMKKDSTLIIQELMDGEDIDVDVYIDTISHKAVSMFSKKKIETKLGGASKTISFKDEELFSFVCDIVGKFKFNGPVDMDFFFINGKYYLSEINPRFGGAYLHAYGAGVDFIRLIANNIKGIENKPSFGNYENGVVMMMYDSVVICKQEQLASHRK